MGDDAAVTNSTPAEGIQSDASGNGAAEAEQKPQYLTTDEAAKLWDAREKEILSRVQNIAKDSGQRGAQSLVDKKRFNERLGALEKMIDAQVQDGTLDEHQASAYKRQARQDTLAEMVFEEGEQGPPSDDLNSIASKMVAEAGLTQNDPEYATLINHPNPLSWARQLERAVAQKNARLAKVSTPPTTAPQAPAPVAPPPAQKAPASATAVEAGSRGSSASNIETLHDQLVAAARRNDRAEMARLKAEFDKANKP